MAPTFVLSRCIHLASLALNITLTEVGFPPPYGVHVPFQSQNLDRVTILLKICAPYLHLRCKIPHITQWWDRGSTKLSITPVQSFDDIGDSYATFLRIILLTN